VSIKASTSKIDSWIFLNVEKAVLGIYSKKKYQFLLIQTFLLRPPELAEDLLFEPDSKNS
jgi:hypothetical protein